jgi:hypothetical protein
VLYFGFVFLRHVYSMLPVSLICPCLIAPSVFVNVNYILYMSPSPAHHRGSCLETSVLSLSTVVCLVISVVSLCTVVFVNLYLPLFLRLEMERAILQNIIRDHTYVVLCNKSSVIFFVLSYYVSLGSEFRVVMFATISV